MTTEELDNLRKLHAATTLGIWSYDNELDYILRDGDNFAEMIDVGVGKLVVESLNAILPLLAHIDAQAEQIAKLREALSLAVEDQESFRGLVIQHYGLSDKGEAMNIPTPQPDWIDVQVVLERQQQDLQWGGPEHDDGHSDRDWSDFIVHQLQRMAQESGRVPTTAPRVIKIMAMCRAWLESMDRRGG